MNQPIPRPAVSVALSAANDVDAVYVKIAKRIMPFLALLFVMAWLDRYSLKQTESMTSNPDCSVAVTFDTVSPRKSETAIPLLDLQRALLFFRCSYTSGQREQRLPKDFSLCCRGFPCGASGASAMISIEIEDARRKLCRAVPPIRTRSVSGIVGSPAKCRPA